MSESEPLADWESWDEELKRALAYRLRYEWSLWARPDQLPPPGDWLVWLLMAGRGAGKTRSGAEFCREFAQETPKTRVACIAPTYGVVRDVMFLGESGLLEVIPPGDIRSYNKTLGEINLKNGSQFKAFSGNDPERLRGPQHHLLWCEELAAWTYLQATWDMAQFGLRLGDRPRTIITTTPRPIPLLKDLVRRSENSDEVKITRATTFDNAANLPESQLRLLRAQYAGTYLGLQELMGELIDDVAGALWRREQIEADRVQYGELPTMARVVVGVDPAASHKPSSANTGIVVVGRGIDGHGYVLADGSLKASPDGWGQAVIGLYDQARADRIVAEANNGGDMVEHVIHTVRPTAPVRIVHASRGKAIRAEPVAALYEQHKMHHVGVLPQLEDEQCTWVPVPAEGEKLPRSPDRVDALVWACWEVMLNGGPSELLIPGQGALGPGGGSWRVPQL